jgi:hypothetical protein
LHKCCARRFNGNSQSGTEAFRWTSGGGIMKLAFTPEPSRWMMVLAGASLLGLLYRSQRRCH